MTSNRLLPLIPIIIALVAFPALRHQRSSMPRASTLADELSTIHRLHTNLWVSLMKGGSDLEGNHGVDTKLETLFTTAGFACTIDSTPFLGGPSYKDVHAYFNNTNTMGYAVQVVEVLNYFHVTSIPIEVHEDPAMGDDYIRFHIHPSYK